MSSDINNVFNAFVEAQKAMNELPEVKRELERVTGEGHVTRGRLEDAWRANDDLVNKLAEMQAALAAKEAALDTATFRASETQSKLDMLLGSFKAVIGEAGAAIELAEPPPPVVEPEATTIVQEGDADYLPGDGPSVDSEAANPSAMSAEPNPYEPYGFTETKVEGTDFTIVEPNRGEPYSFKGESGAGPTLSGYESVQNWVEESTNSTSDTQETSRYSVGSTEVSTAAGPFVSSTDEVSPVANPSDGPTYTKGGLIVEQENMESAAASPPKPYWLKPDHMTWRDWHENNVGDLPRWINKDDSAYNGTL